jgi:hypothetical protein
MIKQTKSMATDPPTIDEMKKGKDGYLNSFVFQFDSKAEVINRIMNYDFHGLPEDLPFQQKLAVEQVDEDAVVAAAIRNLKPDSLRVVVLGNLADFDMTPEDLNLGPVTNVDITIPSGEEKLELAVTEENLTKGRELVLAAATASGGVDNFKAINSMAVKANFTLSTPQGDMPLSIEALEVFPDKSRSAVSIMGQQMLDITNGDQGWRTGQGEVTEKTAAELADEKRERLRDRVVLLQNADDPDLQTVYDGSGEVEGKAVEFVVLLDEQGENLCRIAFGADDHHMVSMSYWGQSPMGEGSIDQYFADYREIAGVMIPYSSVRNLNGTKFATVEYTEVVINGDIPAGSFDKPECRRNRHCGDIDRRAEVYVLQTWSKTRPHVCPA